MGPSTSIRCRRATYTWLTESMVQSVGSRIPDGSAQCEA